MQSVYRSAIAMYLTDTTRTNERLDRILSYCFRRLSGKDVI